MTIIPDASIIFAVQLPDEQNEVADRVFAMIADHRAIVPIHWHAEIANGLAMAVRRGRISPEYRANSIRLLKGLEFEVDHESSNALWGATQTLCDRHQLTAYDAAYLELASRRQVALATLDVKLAKAAKDENVEVYSVQ